MEFEESKISQIKEVEKDNLFELFFRYCLKPDYSLKFSKQRTGQKLLDIISLLSLAIVASFVFGFLVSFLMNLVGYDMTQNSVVELFEEAPILLAAFMAMIWAPVIEETTFRLGLRFSPLKFSISLSFIILTVFSIVMEYIPFLRVWVEAYVERSSFALLTISVITIIVVLTLIIKLFVESLNIKKKIEKFYATKFPYIFYAIVFLFGAIHLLNFENFKEFWYVSFFLFLPQLSASFILAFVRMRYGFTWSVLSHSLYNSFFTIPFLIFSLLPEEVMTGEKIIIDNLPEQEVILISFASLIIFIMIVTVPIVFIKDFISFYSFRKKR